MFTGPLAHDRWWGFVAFLFSHLHGHPRTGVVERAFFLPFQQSNRLASTGSSGWNPHGFLNMVLVGFLILEFGLVLHLISINVSYVFSNSRWYFWFRPFFSIPRASPYLFPWPPMWNQPSMSLKFTIAWTGSIILLPISLQNLHLIWIGNNIFRTITTDNSLVFDSF